MKSSDNGQNEFLSNGPVYSLLAMYIPLAMLSVVVFLVRIFLPVSPALLLISGVMGALAASLYCDFMKDAKSSHTAAHIRAVVIILVVFYIIASLLRWRVPWRERLLPDFSNVLAAFGTLYVWTSVIALKQFFSARKRFEAYTALYQGEQLHRMLYEDPYLLQYIDAEIAKTKRNYLIQFIIIGLILLLNAVYTASLPLILYIVLIGILISGICIFGFFGIIQREHYCAAEGMTLSAIDRSKHLFWIGIFSVLSIVAAVLLSADKSLLPFALLVRFFNGILAIISWVLRRISAFFGMFFKTREPADEPLLESLQSETLPAFPTQMEASGSQPFWEWLKYGLIALAVIGFLWFMLVPLLTRGKVSGVATFFQKLNRMIVEWFKGALAGLASFFAFVTSNSGARKLNRPSAEAIQRMTGAVLGAYSQAKKRDIKRSATLFARLIIWGNEVRHISWKPACAPVEYCHFLVAAVPDTLPLNENILRCGELFEKALYSSELLSETERTEFKDLVEGITSMYD